MQSAKEVPNGYFLVVGVSEFQLLLFFLFEDMIRTLLSVKEVEVVNCTLDVVVKITSRFLC